MLSLKLLVGIAAGLFVAVLAAPLHVLFLARYPLALSQGQWSLGGVLLDPTDLVLGSLLLAYLLRGHKSEDSERGRLPYLLPWLVLGLLLSLSYLNAPGAQEYLTSLHRVLYQVYRYAWKAILFFPLALLLLDSRIRRERALFAIVLTGDLIALYTTIQVYGLGAEATGPFRHKNTLAGALVAPFVLSLVGVLEPQKRFRLFWLLSPLLILRGLLFAGSRGGIVAVLAGCCFVVAWLLTRPASRRRLVRLVPAALVCIAVAFLIKPDLLQRPTIRRAFSAQAGLSDRNMQWRVQHRWPYFLEKVKENPWLGVGTALDPDLRARGFWAATPHNGYLAVAVANGVPAVFLYCLMALLAVRNGVRSFGRSDDTWEATLGLALAGAVVGMLVHNMVDAVFRGDFARDLFWMICALSARGALLPAPISRRAGREVPASAVAHGVSR